MSRVLPERKGKEIGIKGGKGKVSTYLRYHLPVYLVRVDRYYQEVGIVSGFYRVCTFLSSASNGHLYMYLFVISDS